MQQSDEAEFTAFVVGTSRRLLHAADLLTGDRSRAEDLVQHAYARVYVRWPSVRTGSPEAYARRVMLNHYLDWWRRVRPRELPLLDGVEPPPAADPAGALVERDRVQRALAVLTRRERAVVVLRYWCDLTETEIAAELRMAPGTVKSTANRALTRLRALPDLARPDLARPDLARPDLARTDLAGTALATPGPATPATDPLPRGAAR